MNLRKYWNRWRMQILCVAGGLLLYGAAVYSEMLTDGVADGYLERGDYGTGTTTYEFQVNGLGEDPVDCHVEISARQYTDAEAERIFAEILDDLPDQIRGENVNLSHVETDLVLPDSFRDGSISADWHSDAPEWLDSYGTVQAAECPAEGADVWLTVNLSDGNHEAGRTYAVTVYPKKLSEQEQLAEAFREEIRQEDQRTQTEAFVKLPETYAGRKLRYRQENEDYRIIPFLGILLAGLLWIREQTKGEEQKKKRQQLLLLDYADVVYQLMVFVGAGLTVPRAWERIVANYEERRRSGRMTVRPAYEEMADTQAEMRCGVPEGQAIIQFGQRCQLQPYLKLSSLLEQNRRTGTKNLTQLLQQEMTSAWEQQKTIARRLGEEAGTKLLLPLLLMLLVVMVIIMVPALMSMQ